MVEASNSRPEGLSLVHSTTAHSAPSPPSSRVNAIAGPSVPVWPIVAGRYQLCEEVGVGGMATVYLGRILGEGGFTRQVAIKRLHPHLARDPAFVSAFVDEAHLAVRITHPNVVATLDVISADGELLLVMEYVAGASLWHLLQAEGSRNELASVPRVAAVMMGALAGLQAAHDAVDEAGTPLGLVHRDVSPQNILVGVDGRARMLDFGVAKATGRRARERTRTGVIKGKLGYVAPEQFDGKVTRQSDVYAASVVLWEALTGRRLFDGDTDGEIIHRVLAGRVDAPSVHRPGLSPEVDALVLTGLSMEPAARFASAAEMAAALQRAVLPASALEVSEWVQRLEDDRTIAKPRAGSSLASVAASGAGETEIIAVPVRSRRTRKIPMMVAAAALAVVVGGAAIALEASRPTPKALQSSTDVAAALSGAPDAPRPSSALSSSATPPLQVAPPSGAAAPPLSAPSPRVSSGPVKHVPAAPRSSAAPSVPRAQSAKILSVLDTRQ
jgi:eukaryotic-like serine/threonine-protein kinase